LSVLRFSEASDIGRGIRTFLNLEGGVTREAVPSVEQAENLEGGVMHRIIPLVKNHLKNQTENLKNYRQGTTKQQKEAIGEAKNRGLFRLQNELQAEQERAEGVPFCSLGFVAQDSVFSKSSLLPAGCWLLEAPFESADIKELAFRYYE
jgi:hypothetical protein